MTEENKIKLQKILGDKYDVQDMIYQGGMGEIYLGRHQKLGAKVAIKIMIQKLTDDPELKKRFHREAQLYANLRHPNIIHIYDFGTEEAFDYMVFPFIDGENLQEKLKREGRLSAKECIDIMISVSKALAYASENNVIHRDVKPSNIMIEGNGNVLIADFGISKNLTDIEITLPGTVLGSPKYISPEQILGKEVDSRGDQYALGLIFYEMLTGQYPFKGDNPSALFYSHVNELPTLPEDIASTVHPEFSKIINTLVAKDPAERYENFNALIEDLTLIQMEQTQFNQKRPHASTLKKPRTAVTYAKYSLLIAGVVAMLVLEYWWLDRRPKAAPQAPTPVAAVAPRAASTPPAEPAPPAPAESAVSPSTPVAAVEDAVQAPPTVTSIKDLLFNFGQPDKAALYQISINKNAFKIGDKITYAIESTRDCHVVLLDFSTGGEMIQLFPNKFNPDSFIRANTRYNIPSQGSFEVTGPAGAETVIGYASESAFDIMDIPYGMSPFRVVTDENRTALKNIFDNVQRLKRRTLIRKNVDFMISE